MNPCARGRNDDYFNVSSQGPVVRLEALATRIGDNGGSALAIILYIVTRPWHVAINEVLICPTEQAD